MSKARAKGTKGENYFLPHFRELFGSPVERAGTTKGSLDYGDFLAVPWLHEAKNTAKPSFQQWARICEKKAGSRPWIVAWKGDLRTPSGNGPYVLMPLSFYKELVIRTNVVMNHLDEQRVENEYGLRSTVVDL